MIRWRRSILIALTAFIVGMGIQLSFGQGPLTPAANLRVRTDSNGYLIISTGAYLAADGPLTNFGNIRLRTDSNGYLITTFGTNGATILFADGSASSPSMGSSSQAGRGFFFPLANTVGVATNNTELFDFDNTGTLANFLIPAISRIAFTNAIATRGDSADIFLTRGAAGALTISTSATIGSRLKIDALPTVASGFGTSPAVTAGSTPFAGSVNVGTGGAATAGTLNFNGTAFPSAPFCIADTASSNTATRVSPSTTQIAFNTTVAWTASDVVSWVCVSAK